MTPYDAYRAAMAGPASRADAAIEAAGKDHAAASVAVKAWLVSLSAAVRAWEAATAPVRAANWMAEQAMKPPKEKARPKK